MSHKITINNVKIQNFLSIGKEICLDFHTLKGFNYVFGFNKDLDTKNGSGKCVDADTEIEIEITDPILVNIFNDFMLNRK